MNLVSLISQLVHLSLLFLELPSLLIDQILLLLSNQGLILSLNLLLLLLKYERILLLLLHRKLLLMLMLLLHHHLLMHHWIDWWKHAGLLHYNDRGRTHKWSHLNASTCFVCAFWQALTSRIPGTLEMKTT